MNQIASLLNNREKLNVITGICHERYEGQLCKTNHEFWGIQRPGVFKEKWNIDFGPIPDNYHPLNPRLGLNQIPAWITPDCFLSQNRFGHYQTIAPLANQYHCPLICLEHTAFMPFWSDEQKAQLHQMRGNINVFITEWSLESWDWPEDDYNFVIRHSVDTDLFKPLNLDRNNYILTVSNDYIGRDYVLDFARYKRICLDRKLPVRPIGDTKGLSKAPSSVKELVKEYNNSRIFLNTHHISPVPCSLLEAAAMECGIVTCKTAGIPEFFTHEKDCLMYENDEEMSLYLDKLLNDEKFAQNLGKNARKMILEKCSEERFIREWDNVFELAKKLK